MTTAYPSIIEQFTPAPSPRIGNPSNEIVCATVGCNKVVGTQPMQQVQPRVFEPTTMRRYGPLVIYGKRWYFRLVPKKAHETSRARALMDDFNLNQLTRHLVVCATPGSSPEDGRKLLDQEGEPSRIYAYFDSYLEFYEYMIRFPVEQRCFYEIIFGEFPQKPHFDIDVGIEDMEAMYPGENIDVVAELLRESVISACIDVLSENMIMLDLCKDLLQYSSHGNSKRSYHLLINNKCHDGNKEAKAFYDAVMVKVSAITGGKYLKFVDKSVYSPRQQFRIAGSQKLGTGRQKVFYETFSYKGKDYTHVYGEDVSELMIKKLTVLYESLCSFTSGCTFLPSLIPEKPTNGVTYDNLHDLDDATIQYCMQLLQDKMPHCPFTVRGVEGNRIDLKRNAPSLCPICQSATPHEKENPVMYIRHGKIFWDCRRSEKGKPQFFVGYLALSFDEIQSGKVMPGFQNEGIEEDDGEGEFMFGDFQIGQPTLPPTRKTPPKAVVQPAPVTPVPPPVKTPFVPRILVPAPADRAVQDVAALTLKLARGKAQTQYIRSAPEDLMGVRSFQSAISHVPWTAGLK